ncbi:DNA methyltransferase [Candidatus Curtissbacteria bacterium RIFCSPHIGHO2_02_FULL_40_17]|uniref:DNA methyltransferase n=3 Tax=Patescibacteria group TaxID=1783273 RepID=A0A1G2HGD9_9BACT|nr:MAG: DNA methyltransferase [Candidatus Curtissbacteria bacterium RIFCSPHIGHO2_02_FULL_40_17]OGE03847.1 MAG: DNA methyltransferase [Candidatus Curtissbacteria bacterium RIFCSPHIGHO2_12_FULL_41_17]OGZ61556.1 MAG: DNA methyltransferase [Candidatus Spechtbacteria bacterium RIFCSPLOWO2_12_FULL_38_22]
MRFIGNKENLVNKIHQVMQSKNIQGNSFFDFFAGTASVGKYFKKLGYQIFSSDLLHFSYVLQQAYIVNNEEPKFSKLLNKISIKSGFLFSSPLLLVVEYLNQIDPVEGFIYKNYTPAGTSGLKQARMYFTNENGKRIDAIRQQIEIWRKEKLVTQNEYFILVACLIETAPFYANITGVYGAFQKKWDVRALKPLKLRGVPQIVNKKENYAFNVNSVDLVDKIKADIYYLDPPYNQRQYAPNYHLLETISKYDNPKIKGVTGLRDYSNQKSNFCNPESALGELSKIAKKANCGALILSYNTEGIMPQKKIISTLAQYGQVELSEFEYPRFKSNNNGASKTKKHVKEQLYILKK